jgi:2-oxoglutarate ferredoxin oxidoreductase subunit beta
MIDQAIYDNDFENKWCPGCGNFGILNALKGALAELDLSSEKLLIVSGIGQAGKTPHFLNCNFFHGLHGRALPVATGAKLANHDLHVLVHMGDGDCYGEGGNHLLAAMRRNIDVTLLVHDNMVYGLTKGQAAPTSAHGFVTKTQPFGMSSDPVNPIALALCQGVGFVARGYCGDTGHLSGLIQAAMTYPGFAMIDILQICVSFNRVNTYGYYNKRVEYLDPSTYPADDWDKAMELARQWDEKIPVGLIYRKKTLPFTRRIKPLEKGPLLDMAYDRAAVQETLDRG